MNQYASTAFLLSSPVIHSTHAFSHTPVSSSHLQSLPRSFSKSRPLPVFRLYAPCKCVHQQSKSSSTQVSRFRHLTTASHDHSNTVRATPTQVQPQSPLRHIIATLAAVIATCLPTSHVNQPKRNFIQNSSTITLSSLHHSHTPTAPPTLSAIAVTPSRKSPLGKPRIKFATSVAATVNPPNTLALNNSVELAASIVNTRIAEARRQIHSLRKAFRHVVQKATNDQHVHHDEEHSSHAAALGDALLLLLTTVIIIPLAGRFGISPILGFLAAGIALGPNGFALIRDVRTSKNLAELGVVFFLFEMGLELSTSKLKSLGADVFGLGTSQFLITGAIISIVAAMCGITSQAAIVLGAGLALSSSAFVLQLLSERGEVGTRYGRAAFGILLFQDLAVVPVLVLTPLLAGSGGAATVLRAISVASAKAAAALIFIFIIGKNFLQPVFRFVARSKSSEAFIAVILFTVLATSSLTQVLGLSDTLGAFLAGVMLAETKFRHQVEADIKPFRGLLLGLFFITVGFSIDLHLAFQKLATVASMVSGLLLVKTLVIAVAGVAFGLSVGSSLRTGLLLSQGGEFAFVIYGLAMRVGVMPAEMGQLMLLVVALSMGTTPFLAELGRRISSSLEKRRGLIGVRMEDADTADARDFVMVAGWGRVGQSVCEMLDAKLVRYMAFDMSPTRVIDARNKGLPVFFGDARRTEVLRSAGVERARAVVVTLDDPDQALDCVQNIRRDFESVQVFCRARDSRHQKLLQAAGATAIVPELLEASLLLGGAVLLDYGTPIEEVNALIEEAREAHVEELGLSASVTATLASSFRRQIKLQNNDSAVVRDDGNSSSTITVSDSSDSIPVVSNSDPVSAFDSEIRSSEDDTGHGRDILADSERRDVNVK